MDIFFFQWVGARAGFSFGTVKKVIEHLNIRFISVCMYIYIYIYIRNMFSFITFSYRNLHWIITGHFWRK